MRTEQYCDKKINIKNNVHMCYKMYATDERYPDYMGYGGSDGYAGGGAGGGGGGGGVSTFGYRPYGEFLYTK